MFVTMSTYKAKAGEEDAIIALHEDWQRHQQSRAKGYLSGELLRNVRTRPSAPSTQANGKHLDGVLMVLLLG